MTFNGWIQIAIFAALVVAVVVPLGGYMTRVFAGERTPLSPVLIPVEGTFYRLPVSTRGTSRAGLTMRLARCCSTLPASRYFMRFSAFRGSCR
jgi:K+-transporting ATPase A subunit